MMNTRWIQRGGAVLGALLLMVGLAEAKPGKGGGKGKGGAPAHSNGGQGKGNKANKGKPNKGPRAQEGVDIVRYAERDRRRVLDYFAGQQAHPHGLPPGLAKKLQRGKPLPPGWQKKLTPGWAITDEWWPRFEPLPYAWFPDLPVVPETGLFLYGDRVVRVHLPRREVVDVIIVPTIHIDL